ncbi:hypothetical protein D3C86_1452820 [compost metagenome]
MNVEHVGPGRAADLTHHVQLLLGVGVVHAHFEHEAVQFSFRQGVSAFLFDRVLRGEHHERLRNRQWLAFEGDLPFLHGFEQCGLGFRRGTVDLIGQ